MEQKTKSLAHEALHDLVHFDARLFRTLPALLFKPGKITQTSLQPGQTEYVRPFGLFVFLNFLFFVVKSRGLFQYILDSYRADFEPMISSKAAELHISQETLAERFNTAMHFEQKEYFVVMVPLFALVLWSLYGFKKQHFALHLVFSLNYYAFFIAYLIVAPFLLRLFGSLFASESFLIWLTLGVCWLYLAIAVRRVYAGPVWRSLLRGAALSLTTLGLVVFVYRTLLFFIVLHGVGE